MEKEKSLGEKTIQKGWLKKLIEKIDQKMEAKSRKGCCCSSGNSKKGSSCC